MTLDFNPQLLKASEKFLNDLERECLKLNRDNSESLKEIQITQSALTHSIEFYKSELLKLNNYYQNERCETLARSINSSIQFIEGQLIDRNNLLGKLGGDKIDNSELFEENNEGFKVSA